MYLHQSSRWKIEQRRKEKKNFIMCEREAQLKQRHQREPGVNGTVKEVFAMLQSEQGTRQRLRTGMGEAGGAESLIPPFLSSLLPLEMLLHTVASWRPVTIFQVEKLKSLLFL